MTGRDGRLPRKEEQVKRLLAMLEGMGVLLEFDPEMALAQARKCAEHILQQIFTDRQGNSPGRMMLEQLLDKLGAMDVLPRRIVLQLRTVQAFGNAGVHAHDESGTMTREDVLTCMNALRIIVRWYFRDYLETTVPLPDLGSPPPVPWDPEVRCTTCGEKMLKGTRSYVCEACGRKIPVESTLPESLDATAESEADRGALIGAETAGAGWTPRPGCSHKWPEGAAEMYDTVFEAELQTPTGRHVFWLGLGWRHAFGLVRRRGVVFQGRAPRGEPLVEFAGADDFELSGRLVGVIKDRGNKQVPSQADLPEEYREMPTCPFSSVVTGPKSWKGMAVLATEDDRDLMLRHALIRARYKGR